MARKITEEAVNAFMSARVFCKDNTSVYQTLNIVNREIEMVVMLLHGNDIARRAVGSNSIEISNAGWFSNTTKERLNGLPGVSICQKKGVWFLNGKEWDGSWTTI